MLKKMFFQTNKSMILTQHNKMYSQGGFTLIELVMVIVILGTLAAFALPKFANLGGNAKLSVMKGALGAMKSAAAIVHTKSLVSGTDNGTVTLEGTPITIANGFPTAESILDAAGLDTTVFDNVQFFLSNQIIVLSKGSCIIAYLDTRFNGTSQFFGVINAINESCDS